MLRNKDRWIKLFTVISSMLPAPPGFQCMTIIICFRNSIPFQMAHYTLLYSNSLLLYLFSLIHLEAIFQNCKEIAFHLIFITNNLIKDIFKWNPMCVKAPQPCNHLNMQITLHCIQGKMCSLLEIPAENYHLINTETNWSHLHRNHCSNRNI